MTLLTIVAGACGEMGLPIPTTVISNTDPQVVQFLYLANREGNEFAAQGGVWGGWPELRQEFTFNLVPVGPYTGDLTEGSTTVTNMSSVVGLAADYGITANGVQQASYITSVGVSSIVISQAPSVSQIGASLQFGKVKYAIPDDLQFYLSETQWDRNFRWQMLGPLNAQEWQVLQSGLSPVGPRLRYRIMDGYFWINPVPGATQTDTIAYEYTSNKWCQSSAGVRQTAWTADTDTYLFPEATAILGLKWRFLRAKGLDYSEEKLTYDNAVQRQISRSGGSRSVPLNASTGRLRLLSNMNIPDGNFGQSS